jgi:hypothetical protein
MSRINYSVKPRINSTIGNLHPSVYVTTSQSLLLIKERILPVGISRALVKRITTTKTINFHELLALFCKNKKQNK